MPNATSPNTTNRIKNTICYSALFPLFKNKNEYLVKIFKYGIFQLLLLVSQKHLWSIYKLVQKNVQEVLIIWFAHSIFTTYIIR